MKQFKKTPITKERLLSIGFEEYKKHYLYKLDNNNYIQLSNNNISLIDESILYNVVDIQREFKTMESIKELITGLTGKRL